MSFNDFKNGAGYAVALQRAHFEGGRNWYGGYDNLKDNQAGLNGDEFKAVNDAVNQAATGLKNWRDRLRPALTTWLQYAMTQIAGSSGSPQQMLDQLVAYMNTNGHYVDGDNVAYGANPADNVVGVHRRITVHRYGHKIQTGNHDIPDGIRVEVVETEATGGGTDIVVEYSAGNSGANARNPVKTYGPSRRARVALTGPRNPGLATNAVLQGNATTTDGADITDGTGTTGGVSSWDQTRTGTPTVKARPNTAFDTQPYGIGIGKASATFKLTQSMDNWNLEAGVPIAMMVPQYQDGAAWEGDITWELGGSTGTWDETDLSNGAWAYPVSDLDQNAFPINYDDTDDECSVTWAMDAFTDGGEEVICGGIYVMRGFQLEEGGEWHFAWQNDSEPTYKTTVNFGADTQLDENEILHAFDRCFPFGPSLPTSGSTLWSPDAGPTISTTSLPGGSNGVAYDQDLASTGGLTPYVYRLVEGALPSGITLSSAGKVSGTHVGTGTFDFVVEVRDALGRTDVQSLSLTIS